MSELHKTDLNVWAIVEGETPCVRALVKRECLAIIRDNFH